MKCDFGQCNREAGHSGPHGFELEPGLIAAPHGGGEGKVQAPTPVDLACDICDQPMTMQRFENGGGRFKCTSATCEQCWSFYPGGRIEHTILKRMYPSSMQESSKLYDGFLDHTTREHAFTVRAGALCGLISEAQEQQYLADSVAMVAAKRAEIAATQRPWWKRLLAA